MTGFTTNRITTAPQAPLILGVLLIAAILTQFAAPCERGHCDRPEQRAPALLHLVSQEDAPLRAHDCALHAGVVAAALLLAAAPALASRLPRAADPPRQRLLDPPPLRPPQPR